MEIRTIAKTIDIEASRERVWMILFQEEFYADWASAFSKDPVVLTDWQAGSKAIFTDASNAGLVGEISESKPYELLSITYVGMFEHGQEDYESKDAIALKGSKEIYRLTGDENHTRLEIASDMGAEYFDEMSAAWDKALLRVKELAEAN